MKKLRIFALVISCALAAAGCDQKIDARQLKQTNGLYYKIGDNDPFSGTVTNVPVGEFARVTENGHCIVSMKRGVVDGPVTCATGNGKKLYESNWHDGKRDGTEKVWFPESSQLVSVREWKDGRKNGQEQRYNPYVNKLISETSWANNKKSGRERRWDVKGEILLLDLNWKDGKQSGFSKVGTNEENYKDGQFDGVRRHYEIRTDSDEVMNTAATASLEADKAVELLGGGASSYSIVPGTYVAREERWSAGTMISASDFPNPGNTDQASSSRTACVDEWIAAFRKTSGTEAIVSTDQMAEWDKWCKAGKSPTK